MPQSLSTLVILGAGGHGRVVADAALLCAQWDRVVLTDRDPAKCQTAWGDIECMPLEEALALPGIAVHLAIGSAAARAREFAALAGIPTATVIHPHATVSRLAQLGEGSFVAAQAVVAPAARLGRSVIVNHAAVVDHDTVVGDFSHIAPQAALGGACVVGARVLLGSGARLLPGVQVSDDITIGAGAVVIAHIAEAGVYVGVPARRAD